PRPALCGVSYVRSVVELQSELDLPRVVGSVTRRTDFAESRLVGGVCKVRRSGDCYDTVAAKPGGVEVGMVEDVKDFRTELQSEALVESEVLEEGQVQPVESRSGDLRHAAQSICSGQRNTPIRSIASQHAGLSKGRWISEPT